MATLDLGNVMGPQGPQGIQGEIGPQGPQGPQGEPGPPGDTSELIPKSEKGTANGVATLDSSGKLVQMPTAADVGAVSQTVYELTPQNGWEAASAASACHLIVTGKLAALTARLRAPSTTINSNNSLIFNLPSGVIPTKYIDVVLSCGGDISKAGGVQIGTDGRVVVFAGELGTVNDPYSIDAVFLIN